MGFVRNRVRGGGGNGHDFLLKSGEAIFSHKKMIVYMKMSVMNGHANPFVPTTGVLS